MNRQTHTDQQRVFPTGILSYVHKRDGKVITEGRVHNLRTTAGINWQADVMGNGTQPASARYIALTSDATAPAAADTTLTSELAASGFSRALGTYAHTGGATTYTISFTFTASGSATINKLALFNAATVGTMPFEIAMPSPPAMISGDSLQITYSVSI